MPETQEYIKEYQKRGALWIHDNNPKRPHALLTSGKHSNGFFNSTPIIQEPALLHIACYDLLWDLPTRLIEIGYKPTSSKVSLRLCDLGIHWVFGSAMGAVNIAYEIAGQHGCKAGYTEPVIESGEKKMIIKRFNVQEGERVLVVEDVMTTGGTTKKTIKALEERGARILPVIPLLVNRSGKKRLMKKTIKALIDHPMPMWKPEECPLCRQGSEAIRPKGNWDKLTADY